MLLKKLILICIYLITLQKSFADSNCIELVEEIKFLDHRKSLIEKGFDPTQTEEIIGMLHQYGLKPDDINITPGNYKKSTLNTHLMDTIQTRSPYPGANEWGEIISPTLFPNNSSIRASVKKPKGVVSTTEFRGEKYLSFSGGTSKSKLQNIKSHFRTKNGEQIIIKDKNGIEVGAKNFDEFTGKEVVIYRKKGRTIEEVETFRMGTRDPPYNKGSLPMLETTPQNTLAPIRPSDEIGKRGYTNAYRHQDAEFRNLEFLNDEMRKIPPGQRPKSISMKVSKTPCASCYRMIKVFEGRYGVKVDVKAQEIYKPGGASHAH
jgi:hypothetical protein